MHVAWHDAVLRGDVEAVRAEVAAGGDVDAVRAEVAAGGDVDARDRYGQTGLMLAAQRGDARMTAALIAAGAALDVTAKYRLSALMLAIIAGKTDCARLLARAGADRTLRGSGAPGFTGKTAYDLAAERGMIELYDDLALPGATS